MSFCTGWIFQALKKYFDVCIDGLYMTENKPVNHELEALYTQIIAITSRKDIRSRICDHKVYCRI